MIFYQSKTILKYIFNIRGRGKVLSVRVMKEYRTSGNMAPVVLNISTRWLQLVSIMIQLLYPRGKKCCYPLNRLRGIHRKSGHFGEQTNLLSLEEFRDSIVQSIASLLYQLCYPYSYISNI